VAAPTFSPGGGSYSSAQSVTISSSTSGASIRYTTDGSTPTSTTGTVYSGPVTISATATLKAIAYKSGMTDSTVTSSTYTITTQNFAGVYQIQNVASGLVLNQQGSLTNGSPITQWTIVTSSNLDFTFIVTSNGYYQINSVKSGKDVVVQSASTTAGAKIIQWSFGTSGDDQWKPVLNSDGTYTFFNLHSGLVLADPGSSTSTSTQMDQETSNGGANQKWKLLAQ